MDIVKRFLNYVSYETTSDEKNASDDEASTKTQYVLAEVIKKELIELGGEDVYINKAGSVYGYFPGSIKRDPVCLIAHMDTSPSASGKNIKPRIIENYDGKDILLSKGITMKVEDFPTLKDNKGDTLIVTDGTTLLGADDKAGVAIIMDVVEHFVSNKIPHAPIEVCFSTDEEIGEGAEHIDLDKIKAKYGYTVDGGDIKYLNIENFNAASMSLEINGRSVHPGSAKNKMINAINVGIEFHNALPRFMRPEDTENREGFYHLMSLHGDEEKAYMDYIVREHDLNKLHSMMDYAKLDAKRINEMYKSEVINLKVTETYHNMKELMDKNPEAIDKVIAIYKKMNLPYEFEAIRGGTDGAVLTFKGFPCPNLGTGGYNYHGRFEYEDVTQMKKMVEIVTQLFE